MRRSAAPHGNGGPCGFFVCNDTTKEGQAPCPVAAAVAQEAAAAAAAAMTARMAGSVGVCKGAFKSTIRQIPLGSELETWEWRQPRPLPRWHSIAAGQPQDDFYLRFSSFGRCGADVKIVSHGLHQRNSDDAAIRDARCGDVERGISAAH